jgi:hypothetical protein
MFGTSGSHFVRSLAVTVAAVTVSLAVGCGSSGSSNNDSGSSSTCDLAGAMAVFTAPAHNCSAAGCHDSSGSAANFDMASPGLADRLLGKMPAGGGSVFPSVCNGMNKVYLMAGSKPAAGLFIDKLTANPGCGVEMPYVGTKLTSTEFACVQSWATTVTSP